MRSQVVIWNGSPGDLSELIGCVERNDAQAAMLDQRFLNGLLFARHIHARLLAEEKMYPLLSPGMSFRDGARRRGKASV